MADDKKGAAGSSLKLVADAPEQDTMKLGATEAPPASRTLTEVESLRVEIVSLQRARIEAERRVLQAQEQILALRAENLELRAKAEASEHERLFDLMGLKGKTITLNKKADGIYEVLDKSGG